MPCSAVPRATQQGEPTNDSAIASADLPELAGIGERSRMRQRLFCAMGRRDSSALAHAGPRLTPWYPTCHLTTVHIHCSPCPTSDSSGTLPRIMRTNESIGSRSRKPGRYLATSKLYSSTTQTTPRKRTASSFLDSARHYGRSLFAIAVARRIT